MVEAASTSETLVNFYQITRRNNLEDSHLHTCCRENFKTHFHHQTLGITQAPFTVMKCRFFSQGDTLVDTVSQFLEQISKEN
jgi:hypothetical protein